MLIRFTVENFRSFDEEVVFSMIRGGSQQHPEHLLDTPDSNIQLLKTAVLYGANASGKSNLIKAMDFARSYILNGVKPKASISVIPFKLIPSRSQEPSKFEFEFIIDETIYAYGFAVDSYKVHEEWLYETGSGSDKMVFERETVDGKAISNFSESLFSDDDEEKQFLKFVARGTRPNQLLLTEMAENNVESVAPINGWFERLTIVFPESRYRSVTSLIDEDEQFKDSLGTFLQNVGTGIEEVCLSRVSKDEVDIPPELFNEIVSQINEHRERGEVSVVVAGPGGRRYLIRQGEVNNVTVDALRTRRQIDDRPIEFHIFEESDGTRRLFDLFPILHAPENNVFVIDEIERSLHPQLVRRFIGEFLENHAGGQLVMTTHESTLLDLNLLRRDEIWFVEKSKDGASTLYSLEEFRVRHDLDVRKGYLHGRFGAIPVFGSSLIPS